MDALYAKFLPQFTALANERMQRAYDASARPDGPDGPTMTTVMRDLHSIAGEAGLLGLGAIVPIARNAEEHAKRLRDSPAEVAANAEAFVGALDELKHAIEAAGASTKPT